MRRMRESAVKRLKRDGMREKALRGIAVVDVGYTNTKIALFTPEGELVAVLAVRDEVDAGRRLGV